MVVQGRLIPLREVMDRTSLSKPTIYRRMETGRFPRPFQVGERRVAWKESDVQQWLDSLLQTK